MRSLSLLAIPVLIASATPAYAGFSIGADVGAMVMAPQVHPDNRVGFGFAGRLGWALDLSVLVITPEVKVAYERPPLEVDTNLLRPMGGLRVSFGLAVFAVVVFAHVGYGLPLGAPDEVKGGLTSEVGGGIDFTSIPLVDIGIWGAYNRINREGPNYQWASVGASATISF